MVDELGEWMQRLAGRVGVVAVEGAEARGPWAAFARAAAPALARATEDWPSDRVLLQLALEEPAGSPVARAAEAWLRAHPVPWRVARRAWPRAAETESLVGVVRTAEPARGAAWLDAERLLVWAGPEVQIAAAGSGAPLASWRHGSEVQHAAPLADGRIAAGHDGLLRILDPAARDAIELPLGDQLIVRVAPWGARGALATDATGELYAWQPDAAAPRALSVTLDLDELWTGRAFVVVEDQLAYFGAEKLILRGVLDSADEVWLDGHATSINGIVGVGGDRVATWSEDRTLRIWSVTERRTLSTLEGHTAPVAGAVPLPGGGLASFAADGVRLWTAEGALARTLHPGARPTGVRAIDRGGGSEPAIAVLTDEGVELWTADAEPRRWQLARPAGAIALPDGRLALWAAGDPQLRVADPATGALEQIAGHTGAIAGAEVAPGGARLASWAADHGVRIWRAALRGAPAGEREPRGAVRHARIVEGDRLLTSHARGYVALTDTATGAAVWTARVPDVDGIEAERELVAIWSPERVHVRRLDGEQLAVREHEPIGPTSFAGVLALTRSPLPDPHPTAVWRADTGDTLATLPPRAAALRGAAWLDEETALLWLDTGELLRWRCASGPPAEIPLDGRAAIDVVIYAGGYAVLTDDGALLLAHGAGAAPRLAATAIEGGARLADGSLACWSRTGAFSLVAPDGALTPLAPGRSHRPAWVTPAARGLVAVEADGTARYVSATAAAHAPGVPVETDVAAVSPGEALLAVVRGDGIDLIEIATGDRIARWQAEDRIRLHGATAAGFLASLPDGELVRISDPRG